MLDDIPALEPSLSHKSSLLAKVRRQQVAKNLPDYIFSGLAAIGCSEKEIATLTRCNLDDLKDKSQPISEGKARLKHALRKAQIKAALKGNPSMLIWLGKAILGQSDQPSAAPQHTNIVVTSDLLANLQRSYSQTLSDIRRTKTIEPLTNPHDLYRNPNPDIHSHHDIYQDPNPPKQPALAQLGYQGVSEEASSAASVSQSISHDTNTLSNSLANNASESNTGFETLSDPTPPGGPTPTITPTPTPKRLTSLGLGKTEGLGKSEIGKKSKVTKWASYAVGRTAERWSDSLKKLKVTRGGSRKGNATREEHTEQVQNVRAEQ